LNKTNFTTLYIAYGIPLNIEFKCIE